MNLEGHNEFSEGMVTNWPKSNECKSSTQQLSRELLKFISDSSKKRLEASRRLPPLQSGFRDPQLRNLTGTKNDNS